MQLFDKDKAEAKKQEAHQKQMEKAVKYDHDLVKVVEIPMAFTTPAWDEVATIVSQGYTIKAVVEREMWKTSLVILEKINH